MRQLKFSDTPTLGIPIGSKVIVQLHVYEIMECSQTRANVSVRTLVDNSITTVIMVENKKPTTAQSGNPPAFSWVNAKAQLERLQPGSRL